MTSFTSRFAGARHADHRWLVAEDSAGLFPLHTGTAESEAAAWAAAFDAACGALIKGHIRYLAIAVDDEIPTMGYSPSRDRYGRLDSDQVTAHLAEVLREILRPLTGGAHATSAKSALMPPSAESSVCRHSSASTTTSRAAQHY